MTPALLAATHLLAFALGALTCYWLLTRHVAKREVDGHAVLELTHPTGDPVPHSNRSPNWIGVIVLVASLFVVAIGWQAYADNRAGRERDRADRDYANCLTTFAGDLVMTIQARTDANAKVAEAERRRDDAVDQVLSVVSRSRTIPPRATEDDFDQALRNALRARGRLDEVQKQAEQVKQDNQYVLPEAVCER